MLPYLKNIYLAEDDSDDVFIFKYALKRLGLNCRITVFPNGQELLDKLQNINIFPDIIFLDINMPKLNGLDTLVQIKEMESFHSTPVIVYSTSNNNIDAIKALEGRASLYLVKPNNIDELTKMLVKILSLNWKSYNTPNRLDEFILKP